MAQARVEDIEARIAEIDELIRQLAAERAGLHLQRRLLLETSASDGLAGMGRTEAILKVLRMAARPLRPKEITEALRQAGRSDEPDNIVSATLNHLKQRGEVVSPSRGQWELSPQAYGWRRGAGRPPGGRWPVRLR